MKTISFLLIVIALSVASCKTPSRRNSFEFDAVVLLDVQGLYGGQNLWLRSDGTGIVEIVTFREGRELEVKRYRIRVSKTKMSWLNHLLNKHAFPSIRTQDRRGIPDEASPTIWVRAKSGQVAAAEKWANDKHRAFDPIYEHLLKIVAAGPQGELEHIGKYDWDYHPAGFPRWQEIRNLALKDSKIFKPHPLRAQLTLIN